MSKSLVLYFSRAGNNYSVDGIKFLEKGNTEVVAEYIKEITGADLFKVEPLNKYPEDYMECATVAKDELEDDLRPELKNALDDISQYDTIYIGYPIWWSTMPMPLWTQLEKLDFTGKVIKPFATHEGTKLGSSVEDIKKLCSGADVKKGLELVGSFVSESKPKVELWINE